MKGQFAFTLIVSLSCLPSPAQILLKAEYAHAASARQPMQYHWNIYNRISPEVEVSIPDQRRTGICLVRPLGGTAKDGVKRLEEDTYKWDGSRYYYDWAPLKRKIDNVLAQEGLHQLMIDNVPWAFQRGVDRNGHPEVETYGNAWPPNDPEAWSQYIQALLAELVRTYGRQEVGRWRFCVGREIGTGGHWRAGQAAFFDHYRNTRKAIQAVLPEAKTGAHFLWASSQNSYGPAFVSWCKANGVPYDFLGVSYYPFYNQENRVHLDRVYRLDFAPIKDQPDWNSSASLEIHEFALIKSLGAAGNSFIKAEAPYQESFTVLLAKMMYDNDLKDVFQWGSGFDSPALQALSDMAGSIYHTSSKSGIPQQEGNRVEAIFSREPSLRKYHMLVANYNASPAARIAEPISLQAAIPAPPGTGIRYRTALYRASAPDAPWTGWKVGKTTEGEGGDHSLFVHRADLEPFTFLRIELVADRETSRIGYPFRYSEKSSWRAARGAVGVILEYRPPDAGNRGAGAYNPVGRRLQSIGQRRVPGPEASK